MQASCFLSFASIPSLPSVSIPDYSLNSKPPVRISATVYLVISFLYSLKLKGERQKWKEKTLVGCSLKTQVVGRFEESTLNFGRSCSSSIWGYNPSTSLSHSPYWENVEKMKYISSVFSGEEITVTAALSKFLKQCSYSKKTTISGFYFQFWGNQHLSFE